MKTLSEFIAKLDKITWTTPDNDLAGSYTKELVSKGSNWKLTYNIEEMTSVHDDPFRAVIRLFFGGQLVSFWGCIDNDENKEWMLWMIRKRNAINEALRQDEKATERTAKDMWENL